MHTALLVPSSPDSPLLADGVCGSKPPLMVWYPDDGFGWRAPAGDSWRHQRQPRGLVLALNGAVVQEGCDRARCVIAPHFGLSARGGLVFTRHAVGGRKHGDWLMEDENGDSALVLSHTTETNPERALAAVCVKVLGTRLILLDPNGHELP